MHCISEDYSGFNTYSVCELLLSKADALNCCSEDGEQLNLNDCTAPLLTVASSSMNNGFVYLKTNKCSWTQASAKEPEAL